MPCPLITTTENSATDPAVQQKRCATAMRGDLLRFGSSPIFWGNFRPAELSALCSPDETAFLDNLHSQPPTPTIRRAQYRLSLHRARQDAM
jgi:hypothetical protein